MQSAASDLPLLEAAAREAGAYAQVWFGRPREIKSKGALGPVTDVDLAVDRMLHDKLRAARPDYGWLSEETPDNPERLKHARIFSLDPIDGTSAYIKGVAQYTISIGVIENGRAVAGAIYNPATEEMFLGAPGAGATLNGAPIHVNETSQLDEAHLLGEKRMYAAKHWLSPWPETMRLTSRQSIAYRLALVASGQFDGVILFGFKHEWDIAAGAAIVEAAGGRFTDPWGEAVLFNQLDPRAPGAVAAGAALHALIIQRTNHFAHPRAGKAS